MNDRPPRKKIKAGQFLIDPNTLVPIYITAKGTKIPLRVLDKENTNADGEHRSSETP